jgi:uncharacterized protein (DUF302 family)
MTVQQFETTVALPLEEAEAKVRAALAEQGFGVLTEIDVAATLRTKIGVERSPLKILGACNPHFAHQALQVDPSVGLVLPCNVVLEATDGGTRVAVIDPRGLMDAPALADLANDAADRLRTVIDGLTAA